MTADKGDNNNQAEEQRIIKLTPFTGAGAIFGSALKDLSPQEQVGIFKELESATIAGTTIDDHDGRGGGWIRLPPKLQALIRREGLLDVDSIHT